jgi:hypothetical protein
LGDHFFVTTPDLALQWPGAEWLPFIPPTGVDFERIFAAQHDSNIFRVVTSSNHPALDGVEFVRAAVSRLQAEGKSIELIEVKGLPYEKALAVYKSADVYAGKLRLGYYNNANIETMLMEIPNMSFIREEFLPLAGADCPIINTRPETVYANLAFWLERRDELKEIGRRSRLYILRRHDPDQIAERLKRCYHELLTAGRVSSPPIASLNVPASSDVHHTEIV